MSKITIRTGIIRESIPGRDEDNEYCVKNMNVDPDVRIKDLQKILLDQNFLPNEFAWVPVTDAKTIGELAACGGVGSCVLKFVIGG